MKGEAAEHASHLMLTMLPQQPDWWTLTALVSNLEVKEKERCIPSIFAIRQDLQTVLLEKEALPSLRWGVHGTRAIVMCSAIALARFIANYSIDAVVAGSETSVGAIDKAMLRKWMKQASMENIKKSVEHGVCFQTATIGRGDVLYTLGGWVAADMFFQKKITLVCARHS